jgi:hypothetical protein
MTSLMADICRGCSLWNRGFRQMELFGFNGKFGIIGQLENFKCIHALLGVAAWLLGLSCVAFQMMT